MNRFSWTSRRRGALALLGPLAVVGAILIAFGGGAGPATSAGLKLTKQQRRILSGFARFELGGRVRGGEVKANTRPAKRSTRLSAAAGCPTNLGGNVQVNQNCLNVSDPDLQG